MTQLRIWTIFVLSALPAVLLLVYVRARLGARALHAPRLDVRALILGGLAALSAEIIFDVLDLTVGFHELHQTTESARSISAVWVFGVIAPVEELCKAVAAVSAGVVRSSPGRVGNVGTVLASGAVGLGFSMYENYSFAYRNDMVSATRAVTLPVVHLVFGFVLGVGLAFSARKKGGQRLLWFFAAIVLVIVMHGVYDSIIFAPERAGVVIPLIMGLGMWITWFGTRKLVGNAPR